MSILAYTPTKVTCTNLRAGSLNSLLTLLPITRVWVKCEVFPAHIFAFYSSSFNSYDTMCGLVIQRWPDYSAGLSQYWHALHAVGCAESTFNSHIRSERHCCDIGEMICELDCTPYMNHVSSGIMKSSLCHIQSDDLQVITSGTCTAEGTQSCTDCVCAHRNKPVFTCYEHTKEKRLAWQLFNLGCN